MLITYWKLYFLVELLRGAKWGIEFSLGGKLYTEHEFITKFTIKLLATRNLFGEQLDAQNVLIIYMLI